MSGKGLLAIHALLGTLCIVLVQLGDRVAAESPALVGGHPSLKWVTYTVIYVLAFLILMGLDVGIDYLQRSRERRLKLAGLIEGCWLEKSVRLTEHPTQYDMGAFITITYVPDMQFFKVEGQVFEPSGKWFGYFVGHGRPDPLGDKLMYEYHAIHGDDDDDGTGHFQFHEQSLGSAMQFSGSFHGVKTRSVRRVAGGRTEKFPEYLSREELRKQQGARVAEYIST